MKSLADGFDFNAVKNFKSEMKIGSCDVHGNFESNSFCSISGKVYWSDCVECANKLENEKLIAENLRKAEAERFKYESELVNRGIPKRYWYLNLANFQPTKDQLSVFNKSTNFVNNFNKSNSQVLIMAGSVGTGKTRLASAIMQTLGFGLYIRAIDISREVRATYSTSDKSEVDVINYFVNQDLLVIDEVGVQRESKDEKLLITDIIDRRYAELKSTVIVSNLAQKELKKLFGDRAWDRLKQEAKYEPMTGESLRGQGE